MIAYDFPLLTVLISSSGLIMAVVWLGLLAVIVRDVFFRSEMSGVSKAIWLVVVIAMPCIGVVAYAFLRTDLMTTPQHTTRIDDETAGVSHLQLRG